MNKLNKKLAEILDEEVINDDTDLMGCENMDSLSVLSIVSMVDDDFGVVLSVSEIQQITTPHSLLAIINANRHK